MELGELSRGLQVFLIGFGGVFLNLVILMASVKVLSWSLKLAEKWGSKKAVDEKTTG